MVNSSKHSVCQQEKLLCCSATRLLVNVSIDGLKKKTVANRDTWQSIIVCFIRHKTKLSGAKWNVTLNSCPTTVPVYSASDPQSWSCQSGFSVPGLQRAWHISVKLVDNYKLSKRHMTLCFDCSQAAFLQKLLLPKCTPLIKLNGRTCVLATMPEDVWISLITDPLVKLLSISFSMRSIVPLGTCEPGSMIPLKNVCSSHRRPFKNIFNKTIPISMTVTGIGWR